MWNITLVSFVLNIEQKCILSHSWLRGEKSGCQSPNISETKTLFVLRNFNILAFKFCLIISFLHQNCLLISLFYFPHLKREARFGKRAYHLLCPEGGVLVCLIQISTFHHHMTPVMTLSYGLQSSILYPWCLCLCQWHQYQKNTQLTRVSIHKYSEGINFFSSKSSESLLNLNSQVVSMGGEGWG